MAARGRQTVPAGHIVVDFGIETVAALYDAHPEQAVVVWQAIEPVTEGLGGAGGEILGGLWALLVSWTARYTGVCRRSSAG